MADSNSSKARFRSATEFPKNIRTLDRDQADALYEEMRDCLVFTNRSRAQLIRRNEEHKAKAGLLKEDVQRLQGKIQQLAAEKQQIAQSNRDIIQELEAEMTTMASHLDELSVAFDGMEGLETSQQTKWSLIASPYRFFRFISAVKNIVLWWRSDRPDDRLPAAPNAEATLDVSPEDEEQDRRDHPQMYTDQASVNRYLRD
jgi:TolA-binding protein